MGKKIGGSKIVLAIVGLILGYEVYKDYQKIKNREEKKEFLVEAFGKLNCFHMLDSEDYVDRCLINSMNELHTILIDAVHGNERHTHS